MSSENLSLRSACALQGESWHPHALKFAMQVDHGIL